MSFSDLSLDASLLRALTEAGYSEPTPIQAQAIPAALEGHDLIASAQTGTGKTAAFMLPALQRFAVASGDRRRAPRVLVLTPTRELAAQVMDAAHKYGRFLRFTTVSLLGGMPYGPQLRALGGPLDLVVATPGRLIDHLDRDRIDLSKIEVLVLDEADRMLDLGFKEDVERIAEATPAGRQTLLFTATLDGAMARLAAELTRDAVRIAIEPTQTEQLNIEQRLHVADDLAHKHRLLDHLLNDETMDRAIIFSATKRDADALAERLRDAGLPAAALHGDMHQTLRSRTLARLRDGRVRLLVAT
ncbi:MAG TPA: DEAD/DEAH box helicase, partial [Plasticicumulans sp.]|nr:DEAD/DEAH box helicase [Plasticicumulans sp.]